MKTVLDDASTPAGPRLERGPMVRRSGPMRRRGQAQVPDLIKLAAVALPILIGLIAAYRYYGGVVTQTMPSVQYNVPAGGQGA